MAKDNSASQPDILPLPAQGEIHPKGLLDAISYIDQNFANELGGCMINPRFLTTKQRIEFMEVGFRSSFASGLISAALTPIAIGVIERYIPMFGDVNPSYFDQFCALLLALGFSLGYAIFLSKTATHFVGGYTGAMVRNLMGGMVAGAVLKAVVSFLAFHFIYFKIMKDEYLAWVAAKLYYAKVSQSMVEAIYGWMLGFKGVFITSAYFVLVSTLIFVLIPVGGLIYAWFRNRKWISSGVIDVPEDCL